MALPAIFVSHSSKDDSIAAQFEQWLIKRGFTSYFLDHSANRGIAAGMNWKEALRKHERTCRVIVCLVSLDWLRSSDCFGEFVAATYLGKAIMPLFIHGFSRLREEIEEDATRRRRGFPLVDELLERLRYVSSEHQGVDVSTALRDGRLNLEFDPAAEMRIDRGLRSAGALIDIGLDPEAFPIDPEKPPFPGLAPFGDDDSDAALFFGQGERIAMALERLRSQHTSGRRRSLAFVGPSGSGKSSLMKAGVLPRLRRDLAFVALRTLRIGRSPFDSLLASVHGGYNDVGAQIDIRQVETALMREQATSETVSCSSTLVELVTSLRRDLTEAASLPGATLVVPVDQAEEFAVDYGEQWSREANLVASFILAVQDCDDRTQLLLTIRSDSLSELQTAKRFSAINFDSINVGPLEPHRFAEIVEGPARRTRIEIEPGFVNALLEPTLGQRSLPVVAFALERIRRRLRDPNKMTVGDLERLGGVSGLISDAAERALSGAGPDSKIYDSPTQQEDQLGKSIFVPHLVAINDAGALVRRIARYSIFKNEHLKLLRRFLEWRLLNKVSDGDAVEIAHEALLHDWARVEEWLAPERANLRTLRGVELATAAWLRSERSSSFLDHRGKRLTKSLALLRRHDYRLQFSDEHHQYLRACRRRTTRNKIATITVSVITLAGLALGYIVFNDFSRTTSIVAAAQTVGALRQRDEFASRLAASAAQTRLTPFSSNEFVLNELASRVFPQAASAQYTLADRGAVAIERGSTLFWSRTGLLVSSARDGVSIYRISGNDLSLVERIDADFDERIFVSDTTLGLTPLRVKRNGLIEMEFQIQELGEKRSRERKIIDVDTLDLAGAAISEDGLRLFWWSDTPGNAEIGTVSLSMSDEITLKPIPVGPPVESAYVLPNNAGLVALLDDGSVVHVGPKGDVLRKWSDPIAARIVVTDNAFSIIGRDSRSIAIVFPGFNTLSNISLISSADNEVLFVDGDGQVGISSNVSELPSFQSVGLRGPAIFAAPMPDGGWFVADTATACIFERLGADAKASRCTSIGDVEFAMGAFLAYADMNRYEVHVGDLADVLGILEAEPSAFRISAVAASEAGTIAAVDEGGRMWRWSNSGWSSEVLSEQPLYFVEIAGTPPTIVASGSSKVITASFSDDEANSIEVTTNDAYASIADAGDCVVWADRNGTIGRFQLSADDASRLKRWRWPSVAFAAVVAIDCSSDVFATTRTGEIYRLRLSEGPEPIVVGSASLPRKQLAEAITVDGNRGRLIVGGYLGDVSNFDIRNGLNQSWSLTEQSSVVSIDSREDKLLIASRGGEISVRHLSDGRRLKVLNARGGDVSDAVWRDDDSVLVASGAQLFVFEDVGSETSTASCIRFSKAEQRFAQRNNVPAEVFDGEC